MLNISLNLSLEVTRFFIGSQVAKGLNVQNGLKAKR